jgi:hypothetical protein
MGQPVGYGSGWRAVAGRASGLGLCMLSRTVWGGGYPSGQRENSSGRIDHSLGESRSSSDPLLTTTVCHYCRRLMLQASGP